MVSHALPDESGQLISPPPPAPTETLSVKINAATRQVHTSLNKLVTSRLAYAIPPYTSDPSLYLHGIHTFAQLYYAFEDTWQDLICAHLEASSPTFAPTLLPTPPAEADYFTTQRSSSGPHADKLRTFLATLVPPTLWRTQRLENDVAFLSRRFAVSLPNLAADPLLQEFQAHIASRTADKPHVLLAYSWVLYMAIFSGGRWIRAQLQAAGPEFWGHTDETGRETTRTTMMTKGVDNGGRGTGETAKTTSEEGMSLFHFDGPRDGEDIKRFFKEKFAQADTVLSADEKADVVSEADWVFRACVRLVESLDARLATPIQDDQATSAPAVGQHAQKRTVTSPSKEKADRNVPACLRGFLPRDSAQNPTAHPGLNGTKGLDPLAAVLAIAMGLGGWYLLYSWGWIGRGLLSDI